MPFTIEDVFMSDQFEGGLKMGSVNAYVDGGTPEEWVATALAIAYAVGDLGANSVDITLNRTDLLDMDPQPEPMYVHLANVMFSPDLKHSIYGPPQTIISVTEKPASREIVQRDTEYWDLLEKANEKGVDPDKADKKAVAFIAKKYHIAPGWKPYNGGLDARTFPVADYNVDATRAAEGLATLDACMRGKILPIRWRCP